mmetsp:Transcript_20017/g.56739  ORF Transcript_20017/g.56739 Transcript_20017/m.56739 type:complete len:256 (-) Transcript_20017:569-1336(-)
MGCGIRVGHDAGRAAARNHHHLEDPVHGNRLDCVHARSWNVVGWRVRLSQHLRRHRAVGVPGRIPVPFRCIEVDHQRGHSDCAANLPAILRHVAGRCVCSVHHNHSMATAAANKVGSRQKSSSLADARCHGMPLPVQTIPLHLSVTIIQRRADHDGGIPVIPVLHASQMEHRVLPILDRGIIENERPAVRARTVVPAHPGIAQMDDPTIGNLRFHASDTGRTIFASIPGVVLAQGIRIGSQIHLQVDGEFQILGY